MAFAQMEILGAFNAYQAAHGAQDDEVIISQRYAYTSPRYHVTFIMTAEESSPRRMTYGEVRAAITSIPNFIQQWDRMVDSAEFEFSFLITENRLLRRSDVWRARSRV